MLTILSGLFGSHFLLIFLLGLFGLFSPSPCPPNNACCCGCSLTLSSFALCYLYSWGCLFFSLTPLVCMLVLSCWY
ncbi:hypothetical protein BC829DRAFT_399939 [Chytridium lagenaria]|nr:hypothetical protein BC829DRAFT_399939 [Chytridium lagenaria]